MPDSTAIANPDAGGKDIETSGGGGSPASFEDIVMQQETERFNALREMMVMSKEIAEFLPRAVFDEDDVRNILLMSVQHDLARTGRFNPEKVTYMAASLSVAKKGRGREDAVAMYGGFGAAAKRLSQGGGFGGGGGRFNRGGKPDIDPS